ncbi:MAG: nucleoside deaminase [Candidatus Methylacidiphilales bacterium]
MSSEQDLLYLAEAAKLSRYTMESSLGGPFGAVIVREGKIIGRGWNCVTSSNDPTAHAEVMAIRDACRHLGTFSLAGCTIYSSCEPCPMCLAAIYWARLSRCVFSNTQADAAAIDFDDQFLYEQIPLPPEKRTLPMTHVPLEEAKQVFRDWLQKADRIPY